MLTGCVDDLASSPSTIVVREPPATSVSTTSPSTTAAPVVTQCSAPGDRSTRLDLLDRVDGFARLADTTGAGLDGPLYTVTTTADSGPGSLRQGLEAGNQWVVFAAGVFPADRQTVIAIDSPIQIAPNSTLDGRCSNVRVAPTAGSDGALFVGYFAQRGVSNVIIHNVSIGPVPGLGGPQSGDGIRIVWGSDRFFVSHVEVFSAHDEAIEITRGDRGPMRGTIAYSHIHSTGKAVLIGGQTGNTEKLGGWSPTQHRIQVTVHHSWFDRNRIRNPLVNDATAHFYNNYVSNYGVQGNPSVGAGLELGGESWVWSEANVIEPAEEGDPCGIKVVPYGSLGVTGTSHITLADNVFRNDAHYCSFRPSDPVVPADVPYPFQRDPVDANGTKFTSQLTSDDVFDASRAGWFRAE